VKANIVLEYGKPMQTIVWINPNIKNRLPHTIVKITPLVRGMIDITVDYTFFGGVELEFYVRIGAVGLPNSAHNYRSDLQEVGTKYFNKFLPSVTKYLNYLAQPVEVPIDSLYFKNDKEYYFI